MILRDEGLRWMEVKMGEKDIEERTKLVMENGKPM